MLGSIPFSLFIGATLGFLAGLGVGGGTLLILWLTLVLNMDAGTARAINLMFFITAAGAVSLLRWKKGSLQLRQLIPAIAAGCISAGLMSWLSPQIDSSAIKKMFGLLLIATGLRELFYRERKLK